MSKLSSSARKPAPDYSGTRVTNHMGGNSFTMDPLRTLQMIAASCIFGEPQYYKGDSPAPRKVVTLPGLGFQKTAFPKASTPAELMVQAIDAALAYDFVGTLVLAGSLRNEFNMRMNPAIVIVRAAIHPGREAATRANPGMFYDIIRNVARRPDDLTTMVEYFIAAFGSKKHFPNVLKRAIAKRIKDFDRYQLNKHATKGIGLVDVVRITHAHGTPLIDELMRNGSVAATQGRETWRELRSANVSWEDIIARNANTLTHQDILFQMKNIVQGTSTQNLKIALDILKKTAATSMMFPYRYVAAIKVLKQERVGNPMVYDAIESCLAEVCTKQPQLLGRVMCLSDNSGSAWGTLTFENANTHVAEIGNLSAVLTGRVADEAYAGVFGDRLSITPIMKTESVFSTWEKLNNAGQKVGGATENGIWLFWRDAIAKREHWDTVFIYSDMQAGHGKLYGIDRSQYSQYSTGYGDQYIDVQKLVQDYRKKVNPRVNVFCVQTAGYGMSVMPELMPRSANLCGWTGKEAFFASKYIQSWDYLQPRQ